MFTITKSRQTIAPARRSAALAAIAERHAERQTRALDATAAWRAVFALASEVSA